MRGFGAIVVAGLVALAAFRPAGRAAEDWDWLPPAVATFDHERHAAVFPTCLSCHRGAVESGQSLWPDPAGCAACHDGIVEERIDWARPELPRRSNLRFDHLRHASEFAGSRDSSLTCTTCHARQGAPWMSVQVPAPPTCLECHGVTAAHLSAPDSACATCHLPLAQAVRLTAEDVRAFPAPPSHDEPGWGNRGGHGLLAWHPPAATTEAGVAASCATCHARDFCIQCHVDAPEQEAIQALGTDARSLVHEAALRPPTSHEDPEFLARHGPLVRSAPRECRTCHTQESCLECHAATPQRAAAMYARGSGRGPGAAIHRAPPPTHTAEFLQGGHAPYANARAETCAACHVRQDCLACHRAGAARASGYHPPAFLARHPVAAYQRQTACADCHSTQQFCADCHVQAGLRTGRQLTSGRFHDAKAFFVVGHGQAARQALESCVTCHTERDCAQCHSAQGGRRFNPHGPGFDADRLRRRNPEPCRACHGVVIPGGP